MEKKGHRLLQNAFEILNYVADNPEAVTNRDLKEKFPLPKSTLYNMVQTMINAGYLEKSSGGRLSIGIRCFKTGNAFRTINPFIQRAKDIVEMVNAACDETTHLAVLEGTDITYIYKFDSSHAVRIHSQVGKRLPAHATALGKAMLSGFSDREIRDMYPGKELPALTAKSITSIDVLIAQLHEIRRSSIAYDQEESTPEVRCIAVPIMNSKKFPIAGISISMPIYRKEIKVKQMIPILREAKQKLEELYSIYEGNL
jgi:DNA-binding IclR family transcriptional regulator